MHNIMLPTQCACIIRWQLEYALSEQQRWFNKRTTSNTQALDAQPEARRRAGGEHLASICKDSAFSKQNTVNTRYAPPTSACKQKKQLKQGQCPEAHAA
jgi:hypothetical protein